MIEALICTAIFIGCILAVCTLPEANEPLFPWDEAEDWNESGDNEYV